MNSEPPVRVVHIISGDLWAGAESQAFVLLSGLRNADELRLSVIVLNEGRLAEQLRELGIPVHMIDEKHSGPLRILIEVQRLLAREGCDILHTHRYKENVLGALASRMAGRPRLVKTVHGLEERFTGLTRIKSSATALLDRIVTRTLFDRVICVSENMRSRLARRYVPEQLTCIRNGVDPDRCRPVRSRAQTREALGIPQDAPVVGTASRLVGIKGLEFLLAAGRELQATWPNLRVLVVGDGPLMGSLKARATDLGIGSCTLFTGHRDDVFDLIAAMDLFALPSLSEGIPMVLLECMAIGTPIVASRVGGVPEIIQDGESGVLVEAGDSRLLAQACLRLLTDEELAARLARKGRETLMSRHTAGQMAEAVLNLYRSLG